MGWRWHDDDGDGDSGRGLGGVPDLAWGGGDGTQCATRRVVQSRCHTEEVEPGRFVRKCEKTEQLLRDCVGSYIQYCYYSSKIYSISWEEICYSLHSKLPSELVESKTENTEEDVTEEMKNGSLSLGFPRNEPFTFPGLRSDMEALEKGLFGSLGSVLDEAERMTNNFIRSFGFPPAHDRESSPFPRQPAERHVEEGTAKKNKEGDYSEFSSKISDV